MDNKVHYVGIMDHVGQRFIVSVDAKVPATAASLARERTPSQALCQVREMIRNHDPIECEIVCPSSIYVKKIAIFMGPVRLDVVP